MEKKIETTYKILRFFIYLIPAITVIAGIYLVLFPIETYRHFSDQPEISKFSIEQDEEKNELNFGVFPIQNHRFVDLNINFKKIGNKSCLEESPRVSVQKSYRAFLFPEGSSLKSKEDLQNLVFFENKTKYPNGSLLHLKPTNEVYLVSNGKKTLFPGPEIFRAFGYSFDNLVEVEKSALDQFPNADNRVFLWSQPHPSGTIFQSFPSHNLYLVAGGEKRLIEEESLLKEVWPDYFTIPVSDIDSQEPILCQNKKHTISNGKLACRFDSFEMAEKIGRYYYFAMIFPEKCGVADVHVQKARISFVAEKSYATAKNSLRTIFASIVNRYFYKQNY